MSEIVFHTLKVGTVDRLTEDAVAISLEVPPDLESAFFGRAGQHVTVRAVIDGEDVRRSYSFCARPRVGFIDIGVKRLHGGTFSTYATTALSAGDLLDVAPPTGEFVLPAATEPRHIVAIAAGSGITPVKSLIEAVLADEPQSRATLVFGNRMPKTVMFLDDLAGLKDQYPVRFQLVHILSRDPSALPLFSGRIDADRIHELLDTLIDQDDVDEWFLCGPYEMVMAARTSLNERGVADRNIHDELFFSSPVDIPPPPPEEEQGTVLLRFQLDGITSEVRMRHETAVLDAALSMRPEMPYSCRGGMCATCKGKVLEGSVTMEKNYSLMSAETEAGYVLTCQSHPSSDSLFVDYDA